MPLGRPYDYGPESLSPIETGGVTEPFGGLRQRTLLTSPQARGGVDNIGLGTEARSPGMRRRRNARTIAASAGAA